MNATAERPRTTDQAPAGPAPVTRAPVPAEPTATRFRMPRVRMELRKLVDTRAPRVLLILSVVGGALMAILIPVLTGDPMTPADLTTAALTVSMYLVPILAILTVAAEWGKNATGLVTFTLDPRRTAVLAAKAAACVLLAAALVALAYPVAALAALVSGNEFVEVGQWLAAAGWRVAGLAGMLLLAGGLAAAMQSTVMAIVTFLLLPQMLPQILSLFDATASLAPYTDIQSGFMGMLAGVGPQDWATFGVALALWIALPAAIGVWRGARGNVG